MDYSSELDNPHPNAHDYEQLETIYNSYLDSTSTVSSLAATKFPDNAAPIVTERRDTIASSYIVERFANGFARHTFIHWAVGRS
jgi:hypothetical protein